MLTTHKWRERAEVNMMQAQRTHEDAVNQCEQSKRVHSETVNDNHEMYNELSNSMEQKVADSQNLVAKLEDRAQCLENSIQLTCQSLADLESAIRAKDPPLQLCLWRLEQRARRPTREQVRDTAEVSLEEEKSTLVSIKWELGDAAERTKATIADLRRKLGDVRHDLEHKMHALGIDEMCLTTAQASFLSMSLRTPRPAAGAVPGMRSTDRAAQLESRKNEQLRQFRASALDRGAAAREDSAAALREQNAELIYRSAARAQEAKMKSDRATQERVSETQAARMRLEQEIQETDAHIDHTNGTMAETRFHLGALEEPMAMANVCNDWRRGRTAPEHIADPVSAKLHNLVSTGPAEDAGGELRASCAAHGITALQPTVGGSSKEDWRSGRAAGGDAGDADDQIRLYDAAAKLMSQQYGHVGAHQLDKEFTELMQHLMQQMQQQSTAQPRPR